MKRVPLIAATAAASLLFAAGPASAWDCIRYNGSDKAAASGNWESVSVTDIVAGGVEAGFITEEQGSCVLDAWDDADMPTTFLVGIGVAGARGAIQSGHMTEDDFFVLAKNAPAAVLTDGRGIDHLEKTLFTVGAACFDELPDEH